MWRSDLALDADGVTELTMAAATGYLPDDILVKVDRASMAVSLETRVPSLDNQVAAIAARIPAEMKVSNGGGKQILRRLLHRHVPRHLVDRPKAGFAVPVGSWVKGPLLGWAEDLLDEKKLKEGGHFDAGAVRARRESHLKGTDSTAAIWSVLMFQAWLEQTRR